YTQDYDERIPARRISGTNAQGWRRVIQPYIKSTQLFACPSNTNNTQTTSETDAALNPVSIPRSYAINGTDGGGALGIGPSGSTAPSEVDRSQTLAAIPDTAGTVLVAEWMGVEHELTFNNDAATFAGKCFTGHLGTSNFLFVDGHVKAMKPVATGNPVNMWNIQENFGDNDANLMARLNAWQNKLN
ncbi:hypothetical protein EON80_24130, partial [bacterium]